MTPERDRLHTSVDAIADDDLNVAIAFLSELGAAETIDAETAAKLDAALAEPGDDVPLEEVGRRLRAGRRARSRLGSE